MLLFHTSQAIAQTPEPPVLVATDTVVIPNFFKKTNELDLIEEVFNYHARHKPDSILKAGRVYWIVAPAIGYSLETHWIGSISSNISFYTSDPRNSQMSTISTVWGYSVKHQLLLPVLLSVWVDRNKINLLGDYRYYVYPSLTYGLGGQTTFNNADKVNYSFIRIHQEALIKLVSNIYGGGGYGLDYHYNIYNKGDASDFNTYNGTVSTTKSSGLILHIKYDTRDNINNPHDAILASVSYRDNLMALGSNNNWQSICVEYRQYISISKHTKNVLALWSWNTFTSGHAPYYDLPATGWDTYNNSGRGYIQSRYRGANMLYDEAEYRFELMKNGLLGGVVFVNAESVSNYPGNKFTNVMPGEGIGLRIKINKYSGTNFCIDYGLGNEGSKGFFFNLGEVF